MPLVKVLEAPYINGCVESLGYHCVCVIVTDLRYMLDLLWDYFIPGTSNLLTVLLNSTCNFHLLPATGVQDI